MHYFLLIYFNNKPLQVSSRLAAHHQEELVQSCVVLAGSSQLTQRMTIPIVVYSYLILLMTSSKPARNM